MKKIYSILMFFIMSILLASCTVSNDVLFEEYLNNKEPITAEMVDEKFSQMEEISLPENLFAGLKVANTKIEIESDDPSTVYVWQNGEKVYLDVTIEEENETFYADLPMFEQLYDETVSQIPVTGTQLKPSELYAQIINEYGNGLGSLKNKSFDEILDVLNFKYADFEFVEEGKYKVKKEVLYAKLLVFSFENMTLEDLIKMFSEENMEIELYVYFDGIRIYSYEMIMKDSIVTSKVNITLLYDELVFNGVKIEISENLSKIVLEIKAVNEVLSVDFELVDYYGKKTTLDASLSKSEFVLLVKEEELVLANVDIDFGKTEDNVYYLSGIIESDDEKYTITSDVVIGDELKAKETMATNLYEYFG